MSPILKLSKDNPDKECEFELEYLLSLSIQERFQMMLKKSQEMYNLMVNNGHRRTNQIIKRS